MKTKLVTGSRYLPPLSLQWFKDYNFVCSDMLCPPLGSSVSGKHSMAAVRVWPASAHLAEHVDFIRSSRGGGLWITKCWDVVPVYVFCQHPGPPYVVWRMCTHTQKVMTIHFNSKPPVHPYAICSSAYVPLKGRIMLLKGNVIGSSTVLYNTAMASWIRNWDIQHTHTHRIDKSG